MSEHEGICQVLFEAIEDKSEVCGRAKEAISGLSQNNQWRLVLGERLAGIWQESSECKEQKENNKSLSLGILLSRTLNKEKGSAQH